MPPSAGSKTTTRPPPSPRRPSRFARPAACHSESAGATARYTTGKSTSTPASTSWVLTSSIGRPAASRSRTSPSTLCRCAGHMAADRCRTTAPRSARARSAAKTVRASLTVLTTTSAPPGSPAARLATSSRRGRGVSHHSNRACRMARNSGTRSWTRSRAGTSRRGPSDQNSGCVADDSTTVAPKCPASRRSASASGTSRPCGKACTSSSTITELASRCTFRIRDGFRPNSDSNSWTVVVTTNGASQFSAASRRQRSSAQPPSRSTCEWCSRTTGCPPGSPGSSSRRYTPAFCSVMVMKGTATITRTLPCRAACRSANAAVASVLPEPVGAASRYRPPAPPAAATHDSYTLSRHRLAGDLPRPLRSSARRCSNLAVSWLKSATGASRGRGRPRRCACVSSASASTRHENKNRTRNSRAVGWSDPGGSGTGAPSNSSGTTGRSAASASARRCPPPSARSCRIARPM